ncbi:thioredoxin [Kroppenstedtia guangzhouensis]|uniref:Thioredoxin n=1 Tax=Kroppenstedtia guangzhouensis TaxID=1274356 RepID=A0ABQ1FXJ1_9BACL|nr:TlpA disulfide reductase family protein [Kroppenstedtia guangzhouensis]GGA32408.1 thioredoxin [Kroppenstedtia guangzhouensis]
MGNRWRNILIGIVILAAVAGAVWTAMDKSEGEDKTATDSNEQGKAGVTKEEQSGDKRKAGGIREERAEEGFQAPDFTLNTLEGKKVTLSKNEGKPSLVNLWASWCPPCKVEMPHLQKAYEKYGDQVNFHMVNLTSLDNKDTMIDYIKDEKFTFPVLLDETGEVGEKYMAFSIPQTYIVDEKGQVIQKITGAMTEEQLEEIMKELTS